MSIFTNKHVVVAVLVAPIMAIGAWYLVGLIGAETPHAAVEGNNYPLAAKSNCRYESGICSLENGDIEFELYIAPANTGSSLWVRGNQSASGILVALSAGDQMPEPSAMQFDTEEGAWFIDLPEVVAESELYLVAQVDGSSYFAETTTRFFTRLDTIPTGRD